MSDSIIIGRQTGESNVYPSFADAMEGIRPGTTVYVRGKVREEIRFPRRRSGEEDALISILPHPEDGGHIDGGYTMPDDGSDRGWTGPNNERGFHTSLVMLDANFLLWSVDVRQSQGRGIQVGRSGTRVNNVTLENLHVDGARTCPIQVQNCDGIYLNNVSVSDGSNFSRDRGSGGRNWSGAIKTLDAWNVTLKGCTVWNHWGNVITPSRLSKNILIEDCTVYDCSEAMYYGHYTDGLIIRNCLAYCTPQWGDRPTPGGFVFNNEREFTQEGSRAGRILAEDNIAIGLAYGYAIGGNEGVRGQEVKTHGITLRRNVSLNSRKAELRLSSNAQVENGLFSDNWFLGKRHFVGKDDFYDWHGHNFFHHSNATASLVDMTHPRDAGQAREWGALMRKILGGIGDEGAKKVFTREEYEQAREVYRQLGGILFPT